MTSTSSVPWPLGPLSGASVVLDRTGRARASLVDRSGASGQHLLSAINMRSRPWMHKRTTLTSGHQALMPRSGTCSPRQMTCMRPSGSTSVRALPWTLAAGVAETPCGWWRTVFLPSAMTPLPVSCPSAAASSGDRLRGGSAAPPRSDRGQALLERPLRDGDHAPRPRRDRGLDTATPQLLEPGGTLYLSWRVTSGGAHRDDQGRLYSAFDPRLVTMSLAATSIVHDEERTSASSGRKPSWIIARTAY